MIDLSELYSEVPPTKLRNIDEKFCPAATSPQWFWKRFGDGFCTGIFRRPVGRLYNTYRHKMRGQERFLFLPTVIGSGYCTARTGRPTPRGL